MSVCICTMGIVASGTLVNANPLGSTIFTILTDGFYVVVGNCSTFGVNPQFQVNGSYINFSTSASNHIVPLSVAYMMAGNTVRVTSDATGDWTAQYVIYSL